MSAGARERFCAKGMEQDKINAYMTLYTALVTIAKTAAPMIPFMTEEIYRNLVCSIDASAPESVHLCDFPEVKEAWIDPELEANMDLVLKIVVMGRACRNSANIKNRQPIGQMYVKAEKTLPDYFVDIIGDELNVKKVDFTEDVSAFTTYTFKPQLRTVGPKYGKFLGRYPESAGVSGWKRCHGAARGRGSAYPSRGGRFDPPDRGRSADYHDPDGGLCHRVRRPRLPWCSTPI